MEKLNLAGGVIYEGDVVNGKGHGTGKYTYPNGMVYEGDFVHGEYQGKGMLSRARNGCVYECNTAVSVTTFSWCTHGVGTPGMV
jgi:hypothetical protein